VQKKRDNFQHHHVEKGLPLALLQKEREESVDSGESLQSSERQVSSIKSTAALVIRPLGPKSVEQRLQKYMFPTSKVVFKGAGVEDAACACWHPPI
jgi:hypothetical protein